MARWTEGRVMLSVVTALAVGSAAACGSASEPAGPVTAESTPAPATAADPFGTSLTTTTSGAPVETTTTVVDPPPTEASTTSTTATPTTTAAPSTPPATTAPAATAPATIADPANQPSCVDSLTTREQAALLVWPAVYSSAWSEAQQVIEQSGVGGVLLMTPRDWSVDDLTNSLAALEAISSHGLIVATDEEGGDVQRLRIVGDLASQRQFSNTMSPADAEALIAAHGIAVRATGVDMVLGPVVDVEPNAGDVPLQPSRFFVGEPSNVSAYAAAYIAGWSESGLFSVLKHFPGHGAASGDTHITAGVTPSFADIEGWDLRPYAELAEQVADEQVSVMVGHLTVPGLTDGVPATRSAAAVDYLRNDMGYDDALLITDALGMAAVGLAEPEASVLAVAAGIDVVLFTQTSQTGAVIDALVSAVETGQIDSSQLALSATKVMRLLERDGHTCNAPRT